LNKSTTQQQREVLKKNATHKNAEGRFEARTMKIKWLQIQAHICIQAASAQTGANANSQTNSIGR
jgi:hypothetical protein